MIRVLHIVDSMNRAGQETFVMNVYRGMDRRMIQFDFLQFQSDEADYDAEILELGGRIHHATAKNADFRGSMREVADIVSRHHYKIVHRHFSNASMYFDLSAAKHGGATCLIAHSHNTSSNHKLMHRLLRRPLYRLADEHLACAKDAGSWMYGDRSFKVIPNGIDTSLFRYNSQAKKRLRNELGIAAESLVFGHVGRFFEVKNHAFILEVFKEILTREPDAALLLVGDGALRPAMEQWTRLHQIESNVHFLGVRGDIPDLMSAMNLFIMPSLYEGLPVTLVETQTSGLPSLISDTISEEIAFTSCVHRMSLERPAAEWADQAILMAKGPRVETADEIQNSGYNIADVVSVLTSLYEQRSR